MSIEIENESGVEAPLEHILGLAEFALEKMHIDSAADVEILLVNEVVMEAYHLDWMQESGSTDVLSQPIDGLRPGKPSDFKRHSFLLLTQFFIYLVMTMLKSRTR